MGRRSSGAQQGPRVFGLASIAGLMLGVTGFALAQDKAVPGTPTPPAPSATPAQSPAPSPSPSTPPAAAPAEPSPVPPKSSSLSPQDMQAKAAKARDLTHIYKEKLAAGIAKALKEGGPKGAIGACNTLAPELNNKLTEESAFEIARTAIKVRNPENAPDAWELKGLEAFQKEIALGSDPRKMEIYDIAVTSEGQSLFRYLRPIIMGEPCLVCHGPNVTQEVKSEIAQYYPDDKATGYNLGELRGAFSLIQQLD